jgi:hypothetical protein
VYGSTELLGGISYELSTNFKVNSGTDGLGVDCAEVGLISGKLGLEMTIIRIKIIEALLLIVPIFIPHIVGDKRFLNYHS